MRVNEDLLNVNKSVLQNGWKIHSASRRMEGMRTVPRKSLLEIYDRQYFEKLECLLKQASYKYVIKIIQSLVTKHIRFG